MCAYLDLDVIYMFYFVQLEQSEQTRVEPREEVESECGGDGSQVL